ncbi:MAG TPA: hypothetical protein VFS43_02955 [Polyangiaceae bacterium]|nr:hypothetical protein [Polyangiaceae bacterium]
MSIPPPNPAASPRRLVDVLRAVPPAELQSLVARLGVPLDPQKRLDVPAQVARKLVSLPELRDPSLLPHLSVELLHRVAEARGSLVTTALPPAIEPLAARGIVFARKLDAQSIELLLPIAYLLQLRPWEGEDPRGVRALLAVASFETCSAVASHYLGRPATPPLALALEAAWEALSDPARLAEELGRLAPAERRLLEAIEREGGEVETEELLDLEREPMRLRGAMGATPSRRGAGFALERRGFLVPVHPNRHVIPTEVAALVGAAHNTERAERREQVRASLFNDDYHPRRARFAEDPAPLALALAVQMREIPGEVRPGIGTPRSLVMRLGQRFGRDAERVNLLSALSRAAGLWDASALSVGSPPGSWAVGALTESFFKLWRRGGVWDEARQDPELFRVQVEARDLSPTGALREMVLDALCDLGEGRWVPWRALADYVRDDGRTAGVARLLRRWAERSGAQAPTPLDVVRRIVFETLPSLGVLDLGDPDAPGGEAEGEAGPALRLTSRGRALVAGKAPPADPRPSEFVDDQLLAVGASAQVASVLSLAPFVEVGEVSDRMHLHVTAQTLSRAVAAGLDVELVRGRLAGLAPLPASLDALLSQAGAVLARVAYVPTGGFLWVDDPNVRELLRTRRGTVDLFLDPSPPGGLLLAPGVELDRVVRRCRALGVELTQQGQVIKARANTPAPGPVGFERRGRSSASLKRGGDG